MVNTKLRNISAFILAKELIDKKMEVIQQRIDNNQDVEGEYLTYLLSNTQMSTKDVYGSIAELLLAGVDTVSVQRCLPIPTEKRKRNLIVMLTSRAKPRFYARAL